MSLDKLKNDLNPQRLLFDSVYECLERIQNDVKDAEVGNNITIKYTIKNPKLSYNSHNSTKNPIRTSGGASEENEYFFVELHKILDSNEGRIVLDREPERVANLTFLTINFFTIRNSNQEGPGSTGYVFSMHDYKYQIMALSVIMQRDASILNYCSKRDITRLMIEVTKVALPIVERAEETIKIAGAPIPLEAPEKWSERSTKRGENPAEFTERVYGRWLGKGLTRGDIQRADGALWTALEQWRHRNGLPFALPHRTESLTQHAGRLRLSASENAHLVSPQRTDATQSMPQPLPSIAPEEWAGRSRPRDQNPIQFIERVYGAWLGNGLTKADILRLDRPLYMALAKWTQRHGPSGLALPTRSELIDVRLKNNRPQP